MAAANGQTSLSLIEEVARRPYAFDFFQAVRWLQCQLKTPGSERLAPCVGTSKLPQDDPLRFGQKPSLAFAPATLESLELGRLAKLYVNFFGLFGPNGPMPLHFTDYAIRRQLGQTDEDSDGTKTSVTGKAPTGKSPEETSRMDYSLSAFCDIFHHRLISLFFRAWAVSQKAVDLDRPEESRFGDYLGSVIGLGLESLQERDVVDDWAKLYYAGRLACPTRHAEGLQAILQDFFGIPTEIQTFRGSWLALPPENICELGKSLDTGCLGRTIVVGTHFYDRQLTFRIRLGPMNLAEVKRFLPEGESFRQLKCWVLNYLGEQYFWDLQLVIKAGQVPDSSLGQVPPGKQGAPAQLGRTCWLKSGPLDRDLDDIILTAD